MSIKKEDFQVYDKHLGNDGGAYKKLGKGTWYNDEMYQEALKQGQKLTTPVDVGQSEVSEQLVCDHNYEEIPYPMHGTSIWKCKCGDVKKTN